MRGRTGVIPMLLCTLLCSMPAQAATYNKSVQYCTPIFYYNGVQKYLDNAVIMIDGRTYVQARSFANALGMNVSWDSGSNILTVDGTSTSNLSSQMALQAKDYEIASLKKELEELKGSTSTTTTSSGNTTRDKYDQTDGTDILGTELTATEKALEKEYEDYFDDIDFDFSVSLSSSRLRIKITYDSSSENREFGKLSNKEIKEFVEEVCETARDRHDDIAIEGTIKYTGNNSTKYYFDYSKKDKLTCSTDNDYDSEDVTESDVLRTLSGLTSITIDDYSGSVTINNKTADVNESKERIKLNVYLDLTDDMKTALNSNTGYDKDSDLKGYLKDFAKRIYRETDYEDIQVYVYSGTSQIGYYYYDDDELYISGV